MKQIKRKRYLSQAEKVEVAKEMFAGEGYKRVAHKWGIAENTALKIRGTYICYIRVWRTDCRYFPRCTYPRCTCGLKKI